jgi:hypothetical protein
MSSSALLVATKGSRCAAYLDDNYTHLHGRRTIKEVDLLWREWFQGLYANDATIKLGA